MVNHAVEPRRSSWYSLDGADRDVVIVSQIELHRNLQSIPFPHRMTGEQRLQLRRMYERALHALTGEYTLLDGEALSSTLLRFYEEGGVILPGEDPGLAAVSADHGEVISLGTADHVVLSVNVGGLDLAAAHRRAIALDQQLEGYLDYAVSLSLGYLSPDLNRLGSALTGRLFFHLPAIEHSEGMSLPAGEKGDDSIVLSRYGAAGEEHGSLYTAELTGQFGQSEEEIITELEGFAARLVHYEREARLELKKRRGDELVDAVQRALGTLRYARKLSRKETMDLLSIVRLGVSLNLLEDVELNAVTDALFVGGDVQVRILTKQEESTSPEAARATLMRTILGRLENV